jgi:hypothetical protein
VRRLLLGLAALLAAPACYDTPRPECAFHCGPDADCPDGYACRADNWCKRADVPDEFACAPPVPDAAPILDAGPDAATADAALADAGADAAPM